MTTKRALPLAAALLALTACVVQTGAGYPPVPPPVAETMPKPPVSPDPLVFVPGHWDWNGGGYVWTPGAWVRQPAPNAAWRQGYWARAASGWVWQPAGWL